MAAPYGQDVVFSANGDRHSIHVPVQIKATPNDGENRLFPQTSRQAIVEADLRAIDSLGSCRAHEEAAQRSANPGAFASDFTLVRQAVAPSTALPGRCTFPQVALRPVEMDPHHARAALRLLAAHRPPASSLVGIVLQEGLDCVAE